MRNYNFTTPSVMITSLNAPVQTPLIDSEYKKEAVKVEQN
jgi:hypothetical protein